MRRGRQDGGSPAGLCRAFAALRILAPLRGPLREAQDRLRAAGARVGWTEPEDFHVTLFFFGRVPENLVAALRRGLDGIAARIPPFRFEVAGVGFFGPPRAPRIAWAGVPEVPEPMAALVAGLREYARAGGWPVEERLFRAHVTLGRVRSPARAAALTAAAQSLTSIAFGCATAASLSFMAAAASPGSISRYNVIHESPLKG